MRNVQLYFKIDSVALIDVGLNIKDENCIVTIGKEHLAFWRYEAPNKIVKQNDPDYGVWFLNLKKRRF